MALSDYEQENTSGQGQGPTVNSGGGGGGGNKKKGGRMFDDGMGWNRLSDAQKGRFDNKKDYRDAKRDYRTAKEQGANTTQKSRMAGERLQDVNQQMDALQEAGKGKNSKAMRDLREQRQGIKDNIYGNLDRFDASTAGAGRDKGTNRLSRLDLVEIEKRHGKEAALKYAQENAQGSKIGGKAQALLDKWKGNGGTNPGNGGGNNGGGNNGGGGGGGANTGNAGTGNANQTAKQDNDNTVTQGGTTGNVSVGGNNSGTIDNSITNNNNQQIDNSITQFGRGGDRIMNITGAGGQGGVAGAVDGVATAGTLGGMWDVDDSMAAQGKMVAGYSHLNDLAQKKYQGFGGETAMNYIQNAAATNPIDMVGLEQHIQDRPIYHQDQATLQENKTMGDSWKFTPSDYKMPNALEHVDYSDKLGEQTDKAHDQIDDM